MLAKISSAILVQIVTAVLETRPDGWDVNLSSKFHHVPEHVVITIFWFYEAQ